MTVYEWDKEPNDVVFYYEGYRCQIKRHPVLKHLCGYVELPDDSLVDAGRMEVHGGITYDKTDTKNGARVIGFDCAHASDFCPMILFDSSIWPLEMDNLVYRNMSFVKEELKSLVDQIINSDPEL